TADGFLRTGYSTAISNGTFTGKNLTLFQLVEDAFGTQRHRILNGAAWMSTSRFDVVAKGKTDATRQQVMEMLQSLLTERFKLKFHNDTRELPIYELEVMKGGSKLKKGDREKCNLGPTRMETGGFLRGCGPESVGDFRRGGIFGS